MRIDADIGKQMKLFNDNKQFKQTLQLFEKCSKSTAESFSSLMITQVLKACTKLKDIHTGRSIHQIVAAQNKYDSYIVTSLIHFYMHCGDVTLAKILFDRTENKTLSMYGAVMKGYIEQNHPNKAIDLFHDIKRPDDVIYILLFSACSQLGSTEALDLTKRVSETMRKSSYSNPRLITSLLDALVKCHDLPYAEALFNKMKCKTSGMYGALMKGYIEHNHPDKAIDLFHDIEHPDDIIYILLFNACAKVGSNEALALIRSVSKVIPKSSYSNPRLLTSLLDALVKCHEFSEAMQLFTKSTEKDPGMYAVIMKGCIENNQLNKAIHLFHEIKCPSDSCFTILFNVCAQFGSIEALDLAKRVSETMPKLSYSNPRLITSLLYALVKCHDLPYAEALFNKMKCKTSGMYGALMSGYIESNQSNKAFELFHKVSKPDDVIYILFFNACAQLRSSEALDATKKISKTMPKSILTNTRVLTSLLDALVKCCDFAYAQSLFDASTKKDSGVYVAMMNGYNIQNDPLKTLNLFDRMKDKSDSFVCLFVLQALSQICDYKLSQSIVGTMPQHIFTDPRIQTALIDMWGKSGSIDSAKETFNAIRQPNQFHYAALINSYGLNGMGAQAIEVYRQMPLDLVDETTRICTLNACSHAGLVEEARSIFESTPVKTTSIYTIMVDSLSRASHFEEALTLLDEYERTHSPSLPMHMAILSGARNQRKVELAQKIFARINRTFPQSDDLLVSASTLLANVYGSVGDFETASDIKLQIHKSGAKKKIGLSWTVVDGQVYQFRAHDDSHPRAKEISAEAERISTELIEHGHEHDSSWVTRPLHQDETIASALCGHSERLAIAWNFVVHPNTSHIQIAKNLRVCGDCHRATKLIAAIRQCEIIVRDANRIHHFYKNGQCSCNDYF